MFTISVSYLTLLILVSPILLGILYYTWKHANSLYTLKSKYTKELRDQQDLLLECNEILTKIYFRGKDEIENEELVNKIRVCYKSSFTGGPEEDFGGGYGKENHLSLEFSKDDIDMEDIDYDTFYKAKLFVEVEGLKEKTKPFWNEYHLDGPKGWGFF